jgi:hypothetical protein
MIILLECDSIGGQPSSEKEPRPTEAGKTIPTGNARRLRFLLNSYATD